LTSPGWLKAWGKLPSNSPLAASTSSASSPTSLTNAAARARDSATSLPPYLYAYYTTITVVDGPSLDHPVALVEWCDD
jgi:hypothetical protein